MHNQNVNRARQSISKEVALCGLGVSILFNSLRAFSYASKDLSLNHFEQNPTRTILSFALPVSMTAALGFGISKRLFSNVLTPDVGANLTFFYCACCIYGVTTLVNTIYNATSPVTSNIIFPMFVGAAIVTAKEVVIKLLNDYAHAQVNANQTRATA